MLKACLKLTKDKNESTSSLLKMLQFIDTHIQHIQPSHELKTQYWGENKFKHKI